MHINEVKNNAFYQFPQWLLKEEPYNNLGDKAKLMYMLLLTAERYQLKINGMTMTVRFTCILQMSSSCKSLTVQKNRLSKLKRN